MTRGQIEGAVDLAGQWQLSDAGGTHQCEADLPGDGITSLHKAGLIPDPYFGRNEEDLRWIADCDWVYRRTVTLTDPNMVLMISGIDTVAEVWWNQDCVLQAQNAFRSYRVDLSGIAIKGENDVEIRIKSPVAEGARRAAAQPYHVPSMNEHPEMGAMCPLPHGNMLRKQQCDFGWDWNIALAPFGVTGQISLVPARTPVIERVASDQHWSADGTVTLSVEVITTGHDGSSLVAEFAGETRIDDGEARPGGARFTFFFKVQNPRLWWPAGQGAQPLYDLTLQIGGAMRHMRIGLRRIELVTQADDKGASFKFRVNGRDVFAKGANWIPADALAGRITQANVRDLLQSAVDANMNMIRVWGGGRYEPDWFYDLCDELGLMVWQDFMFACNLYPATDDFLAEVAAEVAQNVARLQHHASIALWCGDNELVGALTWFDASRADRDRYLVAYDRLNRTIETALKAVKPGANWWPSSPSLGPLDFRDGWHEDGQGDMHFWSVWHENKPFDEYRAIAPRFCSEFGFQSYPSMPVIKRFTELQDRNIASPVLESHQKNPGGNERIAATMFRYFRWPERFDDFVWLSQVQQGLAIKTAVTHWRALAPHCMGTLYWQLNDTWPVCSWSSLDHGGGWKILHHMARRFYAPLAVVAVPEKGGVALCAVKDLPDQVGLELRAYSVAPDGTERPVAQHVGTLDTMTETLVTIETDALAKDDILVWRWTTDTGDAGADHFAPLPYKSYPLLPPHTALDISHDGDAWRLRLTAEALAHFVTVDADQPGQFSDNAVLLCPDHPVDITFLPKEPGPPPTFGTRDLFSATCT